MSRPREQRTRRGAIPRLEAGSELQVRSQDGRIFNFDEFKDLRGIVGLVVSAYRNSMSTSEDVDVRIQTNNSYFYRARAFLRWVACQRGAQRMTLGTLTLQLYRRFLLQGNAKPTTAFHYYQSAVMVARFAIDSGRVPPFALPPNINQEEALAAGSGSKTLADFLGRPPSETPAEEVDADLLKRVLLACDKRARELEARLEKGAHWRTEVASGEFVPPTWLLGRPYRTWGLDRDALVELACKLAIKRWDGHLPRKEAKLAPSDLVGRLFGEIAWRKGVDRLVSAGIPRLTTTELRTYLAPTTDYLAVQVPIFAASGVNPYSIKRLKTDQLVPAADAPAEFASVVFEKPRAGGEVRVGPFRVGDPSSLTLPRAWGRIVNATAGIRRSAAPHHRDLLFIAARNRWHPRLGSAMRAPNTTALFRRVLRPWLAECEDPALRELAPRISARIIRTTAINIANQRLKRNSDLSASLFGHQPSVLDVTYLVSARVRADLERSMRDAQGMLEAWLRAPLEVVPPLVGAVQKAAQVDEQTAEAICRGDFATLSGLCLVNGRTLVVDTATNCLRVIQWLAHLKAAKPGMSRAEPRRWAARYAPQITLFEDALNDFSRRTRRQAEELSKTIVLPMEEIA